MTPEEIEVKNEEVKRAYALCFNSSSGQIVLTDLVDWCHMLRTTHVLGDAYSTAVLEGRRQVILRIQDVLHLTAEELQELRRGRINPRSGDTNA